jgi:hypothetical protein
MSYLIEGKDVVIAGFDQGIAETPYKGIADMRNVEILSYPNEGSVQFKQQALTAPAVFNAVAYTAQNTGDTITVASTTGLYVGTAIVLASNTAGGLSNSVVYYVFNIVGNTFQVRLAPATGSAVAISSDGTGTLTTYQYGNQRGIGDEAPVSYYVDRTGGFLGANATYLVDASNYVWLFFSATTAGISANTLLFLGNIGGVGAAAISTSGIAVWNGYLLLFGLITTGIDYARLSTLSGTGPAAAWTYGWKTMSTQVNNRTIGTLVSQEDGNLYFTTTDGLGSIIETPGDTFDPTDAASYTITDTALSLPETDESTCIAELSTNLLIGGRGFFVYVWDKISLGFTGLLNIPDAFTMKIVATSQNAYVFAGNRGRIYITNGSGIDLYKKIPDYVTGAMRPYLIWEDANVSKNQLIFSFRATTNGNTTLNTVAGLWAIDLESGALRLQNKTTNTGYTGTVTMVAETPPSNSGVPGTAIPGTAVTVGWYSGSTYAVDVGSSDPYVSYESYIETDLIPVGTYLDPFTPSQVEWKTSAPLVNGESVRVSYRTNISEAYTTLGTSTVSGTSMVGSTTGTTASTAQPLISDYFRASFEKVQWVQFKIELSSAATSPSYVRLTELRVRDWPSGKNG